VGTPLGHRPDQGPRFEGLEPRLLLSSGADLAIWQQNYDPLGVNQNTFEMGDWNLDGKIDGTDLAVWQQNYNPLERMIAEEFLPDPPSELPTEPQLMDAPLAPGQPDLVAGDDSGVLDTDNLTNVTTPTIQIEAADPGLPMEIYRSGVYLGNATLVSETTFEYTFTAGQLQEGENVITARTIDGITPSEDSPSLTLTLDTQAPIVPSLVGSYDTTGYAYDVTVVGSLAYVADYASGLQIIDVSTPSAPTLVGTYNTSGYAYGVAVAGSMAYVADYDSGLQIIGVSNPSAPTLVGTYDTPGRAYGVAVVGSLAYVADYYNGLQIIDVSDPSAPTLVGTRDTMGYASGVTVVGSLAYVADYAYGLEIIDVSTPSTPTLIGNYNTPDSARAVSVVGSLAYVADYSTGIQIIDVSTPSAPTLVSSYVTPASATDVVVIGSLAYVAEYSAGIQIIDVSNPSAPTPVGNYDTPGSARAVVVVGSLAYVADYSTGLQIIDVATSGVPVLDLVSSSDTGPINSDNITDDTTPTFSINGSAEYVRIYRDGVQVSGDYEVIPVTLTDQPYGTFDFTARAVDAAGNVGVPSAPLSVTITTFPPAPLQPDLMNTDDSGVSDTDNITNVTTPTIRIEAVDPTLPMQIYRSGVYLGDALLVLDTTFEYTFTAGQLQEGDNVITARTIDGVVPSNDSPSLTITVDTCAPIALYNIGSYDTTGSTRGVAVSGTVAYVADGDYGLRIFDISTPSAPVLLGSYDTPDYAYGVTVGGSLAYVADGSSGLQIIDVSNPSAPTLVGTYDTPGSARGLVVVGSLVYLVDGSAGLQIIDVSTPSTPTLVGT